jgi:predicted transcriptional regulator
MRKPDQNAYSKLLEDIDLGLSPQEIQKKRNISPSNLSRMYKYIEYHMLIEKTGRGKAAIRKLTQKGKAMITTFTQVTSDISQVKVEAEVQPGPYNKTPLVTSVTSNNSKLAQMQPPRRPPLNINDITTDADWLLEKWKNDNTPTGRAMYNMIKRKRDAAVARKWAELHKAVEEVQKQEVPAANSSSVIR